MLEGQQGFVVVFYLLNKHVCRALEAEPSSVRGGKNKNSTVVHRTSKLQLKPKSRVSYAFRGVLNLGIFGAVLLLYLTAKRHFISNALHLPSLLA